MLNPFPVQFLAVLAYALLRVVVGVVLIFLGMRHFRERGALAENFSSLRLPFSYFFAWYVAFFEVLIGTLFMLGLATQVAALLSAFLSLKFIYLSPKLHPSLVPERLFWVVLLGCSLTLFVTGAGAFAFDLPI